MVVVLVVVVGTVVLVVVVGTLLLTERVGGEAVEVGGGRNGSGGCRRR